MLEGDAPRPIIVNKTTGQSAGHPQVFVRALYVGPTAGSEAQVIVSVNPRQVSQQAAIRGMNEELQGRSSGTSTTSLDFVLGR